MSKNDSRFVLVYYLSNQVTVRPRITSTVSFTSRLEMNASLGLLRSNIVV